MATGVIEIKKAGTYSTVQDYPGRVGYWNVGIPPSGPMDPLSFRLGNWIVGNRGDEAGLEITLTGPEISFHEKAVIALTGAEMDAEIDGKSPPWWEPITVQQGNTLKLGRVIGYGARSYITFQNGLEIKSYLGSKSTFPKGNFGGHEGRPLVSGDYLVLADVGIDEEKCRYLKAKNRPVFSDSWKIGVIQGPYAAPDYFLDEDVLMLFESEWRVHYNSNRLGSRLIGPKPRFARADGGEGGRHPSNVHDYVYAVGTINFTGDMPIVIGVDGPSLGGFTSMATITQSEVWKIGQANAGDIIRFEKWDMRKSTRVRKRQEMRFTVRPSDRG